MVEKTPFGDNPIFGIVIEPLSQEDGYFNILVADKNLHDVDIFFINHDKDLTEQQLLREYNIVANSNHVCIDITY